MHCIMWQMLKVRKTRKVRWQCQHSICHLLWFVAENTTAWGGSSSLLQVCMCQRQCSILLPQPAPSRMCMTVLLYQPPSLTHPTPELFPLRLLQMCLCTSASPSFASCATPLAEPGCA